MKVLPFRNLEIVDIGIPPVDTIVEEIKDWSDGNLLKYSYAFLFSAESPSREEHFTIPVGFVHNNKLVTSLQIIRVTAEVVQSFNGDESIVIAAKNHISRYFAKVGSVAPWGTVNYKELVTKGRTPRVLEGPHKRGDLRPNQRRYVVLDDERNIIFGPLIATGL